MHLYFETERLIVRQYMLNDIDKLYRIMSDARVHIFTKDKNNPWDKQRTEEYVKFMLNKDFKTLDCFHGAVIEKNTDQLIETYPNPQQSWGESCTLVAINGVPE